jgi:hypothetical protein
MFGVTLFCAPALVGIGPIKEMLDTHTLSPARRVAQMVLDAPPVVLTNEQGPILYANCPAQPSAGLMRRRSSSR